MTAPKMYRVEYEMNEKPKTIFFGTNNIKDRIQKHFLPYTAKNYIEITSAEVVYEIGNVIEYEDSWAEDDSHGTVKKAVIWGFDDDKICVETASLERWQLNPVHDYKVVGSVSINADGYIKDWKELHDAIKGSQFNLIGFKKKEPYRSILRNFGH